MCWEKIIAAAVIIVIIGVFLFYQSRETFTINRGRYVKLHYTNWCGYCKLMKPVWNNVKKSLDNRGITFIEIDEDIAKNPSITGYPTIIMVDRNGRSHTYAGRADFKQLSAWILSPNPM